MFFHQELTIFISEMCFEKANQINPEVVQNVYPVLSLIDINKISVTLRRKEVFVNNLRHSPGQTKTQNTRVETLIVATNYLQLIQNRYMFRRFTVLQCSHQHCVQPVASDVDVVGYL